MLARASAPLPTASESALEVPVRRIRVEGTTPVNFGRSPTNAPTDLVTVVRQQVPGATFTEQLNCFAEQSAAFLSMHEAWPTPPVRHFMALRCGADTTALSGRARFWSGIYSDSELARVRAGATDEIAEVLSELSAPDRNDLGIYFGLQGDMAVLTIYERLSEASVDPQPMAAGPRDTVRVTGSVRANAHRIEAAVTFGESGYRSCDVDTSVALPSFAVECPVNRTDTLAVVDVASFRRNRLLGSSEVSVALSPSGTLPDEWSFDAGSSYSAWNAATGSPRERFLQVVNAVRRDAGLGAVTLIDAQSDQIDALAPLMVASRAGHDDATVDQIALSVLAGLEVSQVLGDSSIMVMPNDGELGAGADWLADLPFDPSSRALLLDPDIDAIAVGSGSWGGDGEIIASSYTYFDPIGTDVVLEGLTARIDEARADRGFDSMDRPSASVQRYTATAAAEIAEGRRSPRSATSLLATKIVNATGAAVRYSVQYVQTPDDIDIPEEYLTRRARGSYAVAPYQVEGSNWAWYVVIFTSW